MRVRWTDTANAHLLAIYEYIARDSTAYARRMVDRITRRSEQLADFPLSGPIVPEYESQEIRELLERPFRIIYRVKTYQIDVLAVVHGAQMLPPLP